MRNTIKQSLYKNKLNLKEIFMCKIQNIVVDFSDMTIATDDLIQVIPFFLFYKLA